MVFVLITLIAEALGPEAITRFESRCSQSASLEFFGPIQTWSASAENRTLEDLTRLAGQHRIASAEALADRLMREPRGAWPQSSFLFSRSRSLQRHRVSSESPRALLYGNGLILALTGHSTDTRGNNVVEIAQFDAVQNRYRFGVLNFNQTPPALSEPAACKRCHGDPPNLLWQPLHYWDLLTRVHGRDALPRPRSVYSAMRNDSVDSWQHALNFTAYVDNLTMRRMSRSIELARDANLYRHATLAAVMGCPNIPSFLDPATARRHNTATGGMETLHTETARSMTNNQRLDHEFATLVFAHLRGSHIHQSFEILDIGEIAALRYLGEGRGIAWETLSTNFSPLSDDYGFGLASSGPHRGLGMRELTCHLLPNAARAEPRLLHLVERQTASNVGLLEATPEECALLRELSLTGFRRESAQGGDRRKLAH